MKEQILATLRLSAVAIVSTITSTFLIGLAVKVIIKAFLFGFNLL